LGNLLRITPDPFAKRPVEQGLLNSVHERSDIAGGDDPSEFFSFDQFGEVIPRGNHHWKASPQIVENSRPERKGCFDVCAVGAHANIGLEEVVLTIRVLNPGIVEEHVHVKHPKLVSELS